MPRSCYRVVAGRSPRRSRRLLDFANEDDADAIDLRDFGEALNDGEEDAAEVEVRGEGLRELEDEASVVLLLGDGLDGAAEAELSPDARDELHGLERLADEVIGARLEGLRHLVVRLERRQDDDGQVARSGPGAKDAQDLVAVRRRHHEVEQDERGAHPLDLLEGFGPGRHGDVRKVGPGERLHQDMPTDGVVINYEDRTTGHVSKCRTEIARPAMGAAFLAFLRRRAARVSSRRACDGSQRLADPR